MRVGRGEVVRRGGTREGGCGCGRVGWGEGVGEGEGGGGRAGRTGRLSTVWHVSSLPPPPQVEPLQSHLVSALIELFPALAAEAEAKAGTETTEL